MIEIGERPDNEPLTEAELAEAAKAAEGMDRVILRATAALRAAKTVGDFRAIEAIFNELDDVLT